MNLHPTHAKMQVMDWNDARHALAVYRKGSLGRAARALGVDQTTVGRRVAALERELGCRLFDRRPEGYRLALSAEALLPALELLEAAALELESRASGRDRRPEGPVRLAASEGFGARFLPPRLAPFLAAHPRVAVSLVTETRTADVLRGEADLAVRLSSTSAPDLLVRKVAELGYGLYAAPAVARFREAPVVLFDERLEEMPEARWIAQWSRGRRVALRVNSQTALLHAARAGLGLVVLPCFVAEAEPGLDRLLGPDEVLRRPISLVMHRDQVGAARTTALRDHLAQVFAAERAALRG
jgi:DNA-binding transcriptional LysR family regulator